MHLVSTLHHTCSDSIFHFHTKKKGRYIGGPSFCACRIV